MPVSEEQFDRTLREALLAALQEDWTAELENIPETRLSLRQKRRMRRMLADPGHIICAISARSGSALNSRYRKTVRLILRTCAADGTALAGWPWLPSWRRC